MNQPHPQIDDEMLSAYLDDELNPDDKAKVAAAIERDARLRALLVDLRQIRADIRALPRHSLPSAFAERVAESCGGQSSSAVALKPVANAFTRHRWTAGIAVTAALILIAVWAVRPGGLLNSATPQSVAQHQAAEVNSFSPMESDAKSPAVPMDALPSELAAMPANGPAVSAETAPASVAAERENLAREAAPELPARISRFGRSIPQESIDAVVAVTLSDKRVTQLFASAGARNRGLPEANEDQQIGQEQASEANPNAYFSAERLQENFRDFGVADAAKAFVIDGTPTQITDTLKSLEATTTTTMLLKNNGTASNLGLPPIGTLAARGLAELNNSGDANGAAERKDEIERSLQNQPSMKSASPQPAVSLADTADASTSLRRKREATAESAAEFRQQREPQRTYRVLLIVEP